MLIFFLNLFILSSFKIIFPKISIIISIFNAHKYLNQCFNNLINQTLKNIEIIYINAGSNKNTLKFLIQYALDNRIIILNQKNTGYGILINEGIEIASGKYITIIESYDFVDLNLYENLYKFTKYGEADIIFFNNYFYWDNKGKKKIKFLINNPVYNKIFNIFNFKDLFLFSPSIWAGIYKKKVLVKNNIKFLTNIETLFQNDAFLFKLFFKSKKIFFTDKSFYYHRQTNIISSLQKKSDKNLFLIHAEFYELEKFIKNNLKLYYKIEKYYNTKKILLFLNYLKKIDKKREYIKILYYELYEILKNNYYFHNKFNEFEIKFLNYLINFGVEIIFDIYIYSTNDKIINPKISIIIPIYNSEKYIENCLNSLINQTFKNFEIICVNDGSTDNTLKILKFFEKQDKRIHVYNQNNKGAGIARNYGMEKSKGEYLMFLDSDDIFENIMLEELYLKIKNNDLEIVICNSINFENNNWKKKKIIKKFYDDILYNETFSSFDIFNDFFNKFIWWPWDKIYKKKYIENLGIKFQNLKSTNDLFFVASAVVASKKISFLDKILINHRIGMKSSISNTRDKSWDNFYYALKELKKFIKEKGLYKRFKKDFINYVASFSLWHLETINNTFCLLYQNLKKNWWNEFGVNKHNKDYFYNKNIFYKVNDTLKSELEIIKNINELKMNDKKINNLQEKIFTCLPKISIIIPVYNKEKYLSDSLKSILNQTLKKIEIICINDGSTDNSLKILNFFKKKDDRIIIINQKKEGINTARNNGLKIAKGQYILFFNCDKILISDGLEKLYILSEQNNLEILYFNSNLIFENQILLNYNSFHNNTYKNINDKNNIFFNLIKENTWNISPCYQLINHYLLIKNNITYFKSIKYEDNLFFFKLISYAKRVSKINETLYIKIFYDKFNVKMENLIDILNDLLLNIRELLIESFKYEVESIVFKYLELYINNLEEKIFSIYKKIQYRYFFLINYWSKNDKILLLLILINKKINKKFILDLYKNNDIIFLTFLLFNTFNNRNCFKLTYKINYFKKIFSIGKELKQRLFFSFS